MLPSEPTSKNNPEDTPLENPQNTDSPDLSYDLLSELEQTINEVPEGPEEEEATEEMEPGTAELDEEQEVEAEQEEDEPKPFNMSWKAIASGMIHFVDKVQVWVGKKVGRARLLNQFSEAEMKTVKAVKEKQIQKADLNADQIEVMQRWIESEDKFRLLDEVLPLDDEEKALINEPLQACLSKWKTNLTPETMLIIAIVMVLAPRAIKVMEV